MLPVATSREHTVLNIFIYSLVLVTLSLIFAATSAVGWVYLSAAVPLGGVLIVLAGQLGRNHSARHARRLYLYSLLYLALLFVAVIVDSIVGL